MFFKVMLSRFGKYLVLLMQIFIVCIVLVFPTSLIYIFVFLLYSGENIVAQSFEAQRVGVQNGDVNNIYKTCVANEKPGFAGRFVLKTSSGLSFMLKTPLNYDANQKYPLLIVFAPAFNASLMERYTGLTALSTRLGFIIIYVDGIKINLKSIPKLVDIYEYVNEQWCVDSENIFLAGHSDGGSSAQALAFLPEVTLPIKGIISSAAGIQFDDLKNYQCPEALNVMLLHNENDRHFPGYGKDAVKWWATCNQCNQQAKVLENSCWSYQGCINNTQTIFCEQPGNHLKWPERHQEISSFLKQGLLN